MVLPIAALAPLLARSGVGIALAGQASKQAKKISVELYGYDFVGLITKLVVFFLISYSIAKVMEGILLLKGFFIAVVNLFGIKIPTSEQIPESLKKLFLDGYNGLKFWDFVKILAILLVVAEWFIYYNTNEKNGGKVSPMTHGVFAAIIAGLSIITIPELMQRLKKMDFNLAAGV